MKILPCAPYGVRGDEQFVLFQALLRENRNGLDNREMMNFPIGMVLPPTINVIVLTHLIVIRTMPRVVSLNSHSGKVTGHIAYL